MQRRRLVSIAAAVSVVAASAIAGSASVNFVKALHDPFTYSTAGRITQS